MNKNDTAHGSNFFKNSSEVVTMRWKQKMGVVFFMALLVILFGNIDLAMTQKSLTKNAYGKSSAQKKVKKVRGSKIVFFEKSIDFGKIPYNRKVTHIFRFKNEGTATLLIAKKVKHRVLEGCWSPEVVVSSTTVKPGKIGTIKVSVIMHKGMGGPHFFLLSVQSSDPDKRVTYLEVKADIVSLKMWRRFNPDDFYLPRKIAEFELQSESVGIEAIPPSIRASGIPRELTYAYVGKYNHYQKITRLLVAEYIDAKGATKNLSKMLETIENSLKTPDRIIKKKLAGKSIYSFKKDMKDHFYFQVADKVCLLSPHSSVAIRSLEEVLKHIQTHGGP